VWPMHLSKVNPLPYPLVCSGGEFRATPFLPPLFQRRNAFLHYFPKLTTKTYPPKIQSFICFAQPRFDLRKCIYAYGQSVTNATGHLFLILRKLSGQDSTYTSVHLLSYCGTMSKLMPVSSKFSHHLLQP